MAKQPTESRRRSVGPALEGPATSAAEAPSAPLRSRPANENDPASANVLKRLRRPPSYEVIWVSVLLSFVWAAGWFWVYKDVLTGARGASPAEFLQGLALLILPVLGLMAIAYFQWRAQQLRQVSEILMHQAMRLIRPQDIATDGFDLDRPGCAPGSGSPGRWCGARHPACFGS